MSKLDALWQYHDAVQKKDQLEARIKSTPQRQRLNQLYSFLSEQQAQLKTTQSQMENRKAIIDKLAAQFDALQQQYGLELGEFQIMEKDEECTAAEMAESRHAIETLLERVSAARRELFDTIAWIEKAMTEYKNTNNKAIKAKKEYDSVRSACEKEAALTEPEMKSLDAEIQKLRTAVDPVLIKKYDIVKTHHADPMAKVENSQCGGCNMSLPTSVVKRVASSDSIVECENCGRILYVDK